MDMKQILAAIAVLAITFGLLAGVFFGIYYFYPEFLGFAPAKSAKKHLLADSKVAFADSLEAIKKNEDKDINLPYDSLKMMAISLKDSVRSQDYLINVYNDSISGLVKRIIDLNNSDNKYNDSINSLKDKIRKTLDELSQARIEFNKKDSLNGRQRDSLSDQNLIKFAKIYNNAGPTEIAKILEKVNGKDAAKILKMMQPKKAGKVLEAMNPGFAAKLILENYD